MPANYVLLATQTVGTDGAASVTFSNIPQTGYTDLKIVMSARSNAARDDDYANILPNGVSTNQSVKVLYGTGSSYGSVQGTPGSLPICAANNTANTYGNSELYISNYTSTNSKIMTYDGALENNATWGVQNLGAVVWNPGTNVAITSLTFTPVYGSFVSGSTFYLYGTAQVGTEPVIAPFASGGDVIANDGTYWYHAFKSSGAFVPAKTLSCDVLVIAGGGGGGGAVYEGGGGGAGGLLAFSSQPLTATSYTVSVGAGGSGGTSGSRGTQGWDSQFGSLTPASVGGGSGAHRSSPNGGSGGSGGGGTYNSGSGGSATSGQGYAGGNGASGNGEGGGGGGAGGAGANASGNGSGGGVGGVGVNTYSSWATATATGSSGYYAGGGGGGSNGEASKSGGLGGGGLGNLSGAGGNATANTGSGGGGAGGGSSNVGGNGGSGIVIVRYAMV